MKLQIPKINEIWTTFSGSKFHIRDMINNYYIVDGYNDNKFVKSFEIRLNDLYNGFRQVGLSKMKDK